MIRLIYEKVFAIRTVVLREDCTIDPQLTASVVRSGIRSRLLIPYLPARRRTPS